MPRAEVLALLADCKENPDDDTPRLVLADWLEEHGDARGEFVRLQCAAERRPEREAHLLTAHRSDWLGVLAQKGIRVEMERGLAQVSGHARKLLSKRMAALPDDEPTAWASHLSLYGFEAAGLPKLAAAACWSRLTCLDIGGGACYADWLIEPATVGQGKGDWAGLTSLPVLATLTELHLVSQDIGRDGAVVLAGLPRLSRLRFLGLASNNLGDEGAEALGTARGFLGLAQFDLRKNRMRGAGFASLAAWKELASVEELDLSENYPGTAGVAALARSRHLGKLRELRLGHNEFPLPATYGPARFGGAGAEALAASKAFPRLERLFLTGQQIGPAGAEALAAAKAFPSLIELDLSENTLGDDGAVALARSPRLVGLAKLNLRYNGIGDRGARALAESPHLGGLRSLVFLANRDASPTVLEALRARFGAALDA